MFWANFLHFYQPPDQSKMMLKKVVDEGYRPLFTVLLKHPTSRLTFNVSGCLLDLLAKNGFDDVLNQMRTLVANGQVELTASVKYHPFLPLLKKEEILRQIELNNQSLKKIFGKRFQPLGFYLPEAAYSKKLGLLLADLGYAWTIVDEIGYSGSLRLSSYDFSKTPGFYSGGLELARVVGSVSGGIGKHVEYDRVYSLKDVPNFKIFFRERIISDAIASGQIKSAEQFLQIIAPQMGQNRYLLTGTDGEAYGHHQPGLEKVLDQLLEAGVFKTITISEIEKYFPKSEVVDPFPCSWGTSEKEIADGNYYSRWYHPQNRIHKMQWRLNNLAIKLVKQAKKNNDPGYKRARKLLDEALYSCHFWWASARPWWSIEMIERGAKNLYDVVAALKKAPPQDVQKAKDLYLKIILTAFDWLRKEIVWDLSHQHY